jgi:acetyltransferase
MTTLLLPMPRVAGLLPATGSPEVGAVVVRPVAPWDTRELERFYAALSPDSRRRRFFAVVPGLNHAASVTFCTVDHRQREGFVAVAVVDGLERVVGHVCIEPDGAASAEVAVVVADDWQRRGIGRRLVRAAVEWASAVGVRRLTAAMLPGNTAIRQLLVGLDLPFDTSRDGPEVQEVAIRIDPPSLAAA